MNAKRIAAGVMLAALLQGTAFASPIPVRGVVEGFYGKPWTQEQRVDMLAFCEAHGLNAYIYAPKDDPYHREKWREPYPKPQLKKLAALIREAQTRNVKFIFAVSPGLDASYTPLHGAMDREKLLEKLEAVYDLGVRDFAIFFDDIKEKDGRGQAEILRWLDEHFVKPHGDVSPLLTVPTEYYLTDMRTPDGKTKPYTKDFSGGLPKDALPLFTGEGVALKGLSPKTLDDAAQLYGRRLGLWWNYPVNDYMEEKLALGPVEKMPENGLPSIFFNPMTFEELSKLSLATGAAYALAPENYEPQAAWKEALQAQYGALATEMELFAEHSQHLENHWANIGRPDAQTLRAEMDAFWRAWPTAADADARLAHLQQQLEKLKTAAKTLQDKLPAKQRRECKPQLKQLERLAEADETALNLLEALKSGDEKRTKKLTAKLEMQWKKLLNREKSAKLSEGVCRAFIEETLQYAKAAPVERP